MRVAMPSQFIVFMLCLLAMGCAEEQPEKPKPKTYTEAEVLELLVADELDGRGNLLFDAGISLYPVYERILANPNVSLERKAMIYAVLDYLKCDDRRFYPYTIEHIQNEKSLILRHQAWKLLWSLATIEDMQVLSVLIDDIAFDSVPNTAKILAEVGDYNALEALNVWIAVRAPDYPEGRRIHFKYGLKNAIKCRDELKARLDKMEQPNDEE